MESSWSFFHWLDSQEIDLILRHTIGAELLLILAASMILVFWKRWTVFNERQMRRGIRKALTLFKAYIADGGDKRAIHFPYSSKTTYFLVQMIHGLDDLDIAGADEERRKQDLRRHIMETVVYGRAHALSDSRYSGRRSLALSCFRLAPRADDEPVILKMMKDQVSIIRMGAARLALRIGTKAGTDAIIEFLLNEKRLMRNLIGVSAREASEGFIDEVRRRLGEAKDPFVQKIYLDLIAGRLNDSLDGERVFFLTKAENRDLRIAAMRALCKSRCRQALAALKNAVKDPEWEVRAAACRLFGERKFEEGIPLLIEATRDPSWWVRKNSSFALAEFGAEGESALLELSKSNDQFSREIAELALKAAVSSGKAVPA